MMWKRFALRCAHSNSRNSKTFKKKPPSTITQWKHKLVDLYISQRAKSSPSKASLGAKTSALSNWFAGLRRKCRRVDYSNRLEQLALDSRAWREVRHWFKEHKEHTMGGDGTSLTSVLVVYGDAGIGKSSGVRRLAEEHDFSVQLLESERLSDRAFVDRVLRPACSRSTMATASLLQDDDCYVAKAPPQRKCVVLEDVDANFSYGDSQHIARIIETCRCSRSPIIMTCIDAQCVLVHRLVQSTVCRVVEIKRPTLLHIRRILLPLSLENTITMTLARGCRGDLRRLKSLLDDGRRAGVLPGSLRGVQRLIRETSADDTASPLRIFPLLVSEPEWQRAGVEEMFSRATQMDSQLLASMFFENYLVNIFRPHLSEDQALEAIADGAGALSDMQAIYDYRDSEYHPHEVHEITTAMALRAAHASKGILWRPIYPHSERDHLQQQRQLEQLMHTFESRKEEGIYSFTSRHRLESLEICAMRALRDNEKGVEEKNRVLYGAGVRHRHELQMMQNLIFSSSFSSVSAAELGERAKQFSIPPTIAKEKRDDKRSLVASLGSAVLKKRFLERHFS